MCLPGTEVTRAARAAEKSWLPSSDLACLEACSSSFKATTYAARASSKSEVSGDWESCRHQLSAGLRCDRGLLPACLGSVGGIWCLLLCI